MTLSSSDYFRYFAAGPELQRWGLGVTGAGFARVPAGAAYPLGAHPADHHFNWERGRVLEALQIVLISEGSGVFESGPTGRKAVEPGTAIALLPRTWHRYRPDPATGWTESWVEVQGPVADALCRSGVFRARSAIRRMGPDAGLEPALQTVHLRARGVTGFDPELSAAAFAVLAAWEKSAKLQPTRSRIVRAVAAAELHLAEHLAEPVNVAGLARNLGVAYSHFRREFKAHTGFAPWQYVLHLRLSRARRLLASGQFTLDDVASRLGFSSGFHLSSAFKRAFGTSPEHWRRRLTAGGREPADTKVSRPRTRR